MNFYFVLRMNQVSSRHEELIAELCFSYGAQGLSEALQFTQASLRYEPETIQTPFHDLEAYFTARPSDELLFKIAQQYPDVEVSVREEIEKDWLEEWKKGFEPFCLAGDLWIVPSWREAPPQAQRKIWLDPGMAFGTGTHATTQLAAGFLAQMKLSGKSLVDVGTGTGILAMGAALWGATRIVGTEIDAQARIVARENLALNKLEKIEIPDIQIERLEGNFNIVVANIIDGVLIELRETLADHVGPQGHLILTGILNEREAEFIREFAWENLGFHKIARTEKDEWIGFHLQRNSQ